MIIPPSALKKKLRILGMACSGGVRVTKLLASVTTVFMASTGRTGAASTTAVASAPFYDKAIELRYTALTAPCRNAVAVSGRINVTSVASCEDKCDAQAAAAPGEKVEAGPLFLTHSSPFSTRCFVVRQPPSPR